MKCYKKASERGNIEDQYELATCYKYGIGVDEKDAEKKAFRGIFFIFIFCMLTIFIFADFIIKPGPAHVIFVAI